MKLLYCPACNHIFNLTNHLRSCQCGEVKGLYVDNSHAEVSGKGYSIAIGNGSFFAALANKDNDGKDWRDNPEWQKWWAERPAKNLMLAWAREHYDATNSHTSINPNL